MLLYGFGFLIVQPGQPVVGTPVDMEQLVQLGMDCLSVAMLGALYDEGHQPRGKNRESVPAESFALEPPPQQPISRDNGEGQWAGSDHAYFGQEMPECLHGFGDPSGAASQGSIATRK